MTYIFKKYQNKSKAELLIEVSELLRKCKYYENKNKALVLRLKK
jgi:hypothetical protein